MSKPAFDRVGFEILWQHANPLVDIVFVHGLMGDRRETWAKGTTLWPESLLPAKVPQSRILTFGYDADIYHFWSPASDNTIKNHADSLIAGLVAFRYDKKETVERPIIFVAHSLGGLALSMAEDSLQSDNNRISDCTRRIAFLGTPHQGSDKAQWVELGKNFLSILSNKTTGGILKELEQGSVTLGNLAAEFPKWLSHRKEKIKVVCFFEELSTNISGKSIGKIVTETAAKLPEYETLSIHANHCDMCKFSDPKDGNYLKVANILEKWATELKDEVKEDEAKKEDPQTFGNITANNKFGKHNQGTQAGFVHSEGPTNFGSGFTGSMNSPK